MYNHASEKRFIEMPSMYQPTLRQDQIRALYQHKRLRNRPMTSLLREAVDNSSVRL